MSIKISKFDILGRLKRWYAADLAEVSPINFLDKTDGEYILVSLIYLSKI
jgi:hypothetical protein